MQKKQQAGLQVFENLHSQGAGELVVRCCFAGTTAPRPAPLLSRDCASAMWQRFLLRVAATNWETSNLQLEGSPLAPNDIDARPAPQVVTFKLRTVDDKRVVEVDARATPAELHSDLARPFHGCCSNAR
jgi:hypothetical protein